MADDRAPTVLNLRVAHPARMYDYYLGGKNNFAADRSAAEQALAVAPELRAIARENRAFLQRAVTYLVKSGIRQFVDIGAGLPTQRNVHQVAQETCRYFTNEPVPDDVLLTAFDAARFAPQGGNRQPVRWVVVRDTERKRLLRDWYLQPWQAYLAGIGVGEVRIGALPQAVIDANHFAEHLHQVPAIVVQCAELDSLHPTDLDSGRLSVVGGGSIYPTTQNPSAAAHAATAAHGRLVKVVDSPGGDDISPAVARAAVTLASASAVYLDEDAATDPDTRPLRTGRSGTPVLRQNARYQGYRGQREPVEANKRAMFGRAKFDLLRVRGSS